MDDYTFKVFIQSKSKCVILTAENTFQWKLCAEKWTLDTPNTGSFPLTFQLQFVKYNTFSFLMDH